MNINSFSSPSQVPATAFDFPDEIVDLIYTYRRRSLYQGHKARLFAAVHKELMFSSDIISILKGKGWTMWQALALAGKRWRAGFRIASEAPLMPLFPAQMW